jgi:hypothetical protein
VPSTKVHVGNPSSPYKQSSCIPTPIPTGDVCHVRTKAKYEDFGYICACDDERRPLIRSHFTNIAVYLLQTLRICWSEQECSNSNKHTALKSCSFWRLSSVDRSLKLS